MPNRRWFDRQLHDCIQDNKESGKKFALMLLNIDRFKSINLGHAAGDELLIVLADRIKAVAGTSFTVSRLGGDEFAILLPRLESPQLLQEVACRIKKKIVKPVMLKQIEIQITISIGIAVYPADGADAATLYRNTDAAMRMAKECGGNQHQFYSSMTVLNTSQSFMMEQALRKTVERGELELHYQPQFRAMDGSLVGAEVLIRWRHADEMLSPSVFIPLAEKMGLIVAIGEWVLQTACRQAALWQRTCGANLKIAVNVSPMQLGQANFISAVSRIMKETSLLPGTVDVGNDRKRRHSGCADGAGQFNRPEKHGHRNFAERFRNRLFLTQLSAQVSSRFNQIGEELHPRYCGEGR